MNLFDKCTILLIADLKLMFLKIRKIIVVFPILLLLVCSCTGGDFVSFFRSYNRNLPIGRLETKINTLTQTNYGHIILVYDLLDLSVTKHRNSSVTSSRISNFYLYLTTTDMEEEKFDRLIDRLVQRVIFKTKDRHQVNNLLNIRVEQKIKDLQVSLESLYNKFKAKKIHQSNQIKIAIGKLITYFEYTNSELSSMSLQQKLWILQKINEVTEKIPLNSPVYKYKVTDKFHMRSGSFFKSKRMHSGIDLVGTKSCNVFATASGVVSYSGAMGGYGNLVRIDHGRGVTTYYAHLKKIGVRAGRVILVGERVGVQGNTGNSTNDHLHYEIRFNNHPINPEILHKF